MARRRTPQRQHAIPRKPRRLGTIPAVFATLLLATLAVGAGLAGQQAAAPSDASRPAAEPTLVTPPSETGTPIAMPSPSTLGRFAQKDETAFIASCVADAPANTVPTAIAQAFCVCTLNAYETMYPSYDALSAALASGALTDGTRTQVSDRCVRSILGG